MRKTTKRLLAVLLALVMVIGLLPTLAFADHTISGEAKASEEVYVYTDEDYAALQNDVFAKIEAVKADAAQQLGGISRMTEQDYVNLVPEVINAVTNSATYVPGTLQQNGSFLVWMTSTGLPCCYSPRMEAELHNTENDPTPAEIAKAEERAAAILAEASATRGGGPGSMNIGLIQPFWESTSNYADSSFNDYSPSYKAMWQSLADTTGGQTIRYTMSNATVDNIASTMSQCGVVIFDSHGDTDYSGSNQDYTSRANTSYLCLTATSGFTSVDTAAQTGEFGTYYNAMVSNGYGFVNGTAIANHMAGNAPNSLLYMGICLGMATDGMHKGLRQKGVEVVHGYSQSVTFVGEELYMNAILGHVKDGDNYSTAITQAKNDLCWWDPHPSYTSYTESQAASNRIAFPIVVSSEDVYPGHGNVDAIQNVYSTWNLFGDSFEVTAVSNNSAWGTVEVTGWRITATPAEGYYAAGAEVTSGTATVTQNGNIFSVSPETDCTVQINFAAKTPAVVTYVSSGTTVGTVNTFIGDDVILPADVTEIPGWTFLGWMTDHISMTTEKPAYMKPGTSYTVNAENVTIFAVYKHVEGNGGTVYQLVTETPRGAFDGRYVISSAKDSSMNVMTGVSGSVNVESSSAGFTAFGSTGIELEDNALRNVDDAYIFEVEEQGSNAYSFQNVDAGSYLAVYDSYFWVRADYESAYCNWSITPSADGAVLRCGASTSFPYLSWSGSRWVASSGSSYVQLWKEYDDGTTYYWTDPVVEEHEHEMIPYAAVAPTCGTEGNIAYFQCSVCFKYFSDDAGENEITLASTVIPATGEHNFGAWTSNNDGSHKHTCAVCGYEAGEDCIFDEGVVTPPTTTTQGYTTYTCTICGYSYKGNYVSSLGVDYTVEFSVPVECEQPNDMISNTNTGITLPVIAAPEGYKFLGWVDDIYDNVDTKPDGILTGHYVAPYDITLYALFKYVDAEGGSGVSAFELVTEDPGDWTGNYVITYGNTTSLYAMKGMADGTSYETSNNGSAVAYASTGMTLEDNMLADVADDYIFELKQESSGNYSIFNNAFNSYVGIQDGTLYALANYSASACDWNMSLNASGYTDAHLNAGGSWPYIAFSTYSYKFWCYSSNNGIYFWKETEGGTPYWTTIIGEPNPGVDYTVTFTTPAGVTAPAPMVINSMTGANLPTVEAPEGYSFLGWVLDDYDNVDVKPVRIYSGKFRPQADTTLKALFTYVVDGEGIGYELVTEDQTDWTGNYVISCYETPEKLILMGAVAGGNTYEAANNGGVVLFANSGASLEDNVLTDVPENCVFSIQPLGGGYTIQNLGNNTFVGRNVTTESQSARLHSYASYETNYCRWSFTWGEHGNTDSVYNVMIEHVNDAGLNGSYPYLGCGYYYFFSEDEYTENYPYFWVDGTGETYDSDVYYMYLWKETGAGTRYWTTVIEDENDDTEEDLVDVYFVDQDDNANAYVYAFGPGAENAGFPGEQLTPMGVDESGDNWYKITLDRNVYTNVIFSGGDNSTQTADLWVGEDDAIVYYINGHTGYVGIDLWPAPPEVTPATCTAAALENYTGLLTGEVHVHEVGLPLGHDWGEWEVTTAPSCMDGGVQTRTCARCGEIETEQLEPLGHLPGEPVQENYVAPTATEDGGYDMVVYCERCGEELSREHTVLPATGPVEPIETTALRIFSSISVGTDMVVTWTTRKTDVASYEKFWIEVVKHGLDGDETYRYGADQAEALNEGSSSWSCDFKHVFAKEMGVEIEARVYAEDANGQVYMSPAKTTNIRDYLGGRLTATNNAVSQRVLAADMLNYGAAAQLYMGYDTEHLVNEELTAEQLAKLDEYETKTLPDVAKTNSNYRPEGQSNILFNSVSLDNEVILNLIVRAAEGAEVKVLMKDHESGTVLETLDAARNGSNYAVNYSGIGADKMRVEYDFVAQINGAETGNTRTWSVEGYVGELRNGNNQLQINVANALLTYGDSAAAYFAAQ